MLTEDFRSSLAGAIDRASTHLEELEQAGGDRANVKAHSIAAGSMTD